jgi:hypothetical protein
VSATLDPSCGFAIAAWLNPQTFGGSATFNYSYDPGTGRSALVDFDVADAAGQWTTAAFNVFVGYMPYGDGISQIIYLSNKSAQSAAVKVKANNQSGASCSFTAGTIKPTSVLSLSDGLAQAIHACFGVGYTGKVSFTLNALLPVGSAELYTAYNVKGDRVNVVNTSNGRVTSQGTSRVGSGL